MVVLTENEKEIECIEDLEYDQVLILTNKIRIGTSFNNDAHNTKGRFRSGVKNIVMLPIISDQYWVVASRIYMLWICYSLQLEYAWFTITRFMHYITSFFGLISIKIIESNEFIIMSYQTANKEANKQQ